jgi:uncharacterized protein
MRLVIALACAALLGTPAAAQAPVALAPGETLLSVEAEGHYPTRPDTLTLSAGVVTTGATAAEAADANAVLAQRVIAAIRGAGIEARDIRTSNFQVLPRFEDDRESANPADRSRLPRILGYEVTNMVTIRLRDLASAPSVISRLFAAGANSVSRPRFSVSDEHAAQAAEFAAERAAIALARAKAENYAAALGRRVGRILRISERRIWTQGDEADQNTAVMGSLFQPTTPIEAGELRANATVFVDFALAPQ